jgi:tight adherence protein B
MSQLIILILSFASVALLFYALSPFFIQRYGSVHKQQAKQVSGKLADMFVWVGERKLIMYLSLSPLIFGITLYALSGKPILVAIGVVFGFIFPTFVLKYLGKMRKAKFKAQLVDVLTSICQSLKAGLSFLQALEVIVEDMPAPASQELALIVKENKMGIPIEVSFERMNQKMESEDLNLVTTAILVARETGGNLTDVLYHLSGNIRSRNKIAQQVLTLTIQARWQGVIMSLLPVAFAAFIFKTNPRFFDTMLESDVGRMLLIWCVISETIGAVLINRLSKVDI